MWGDDPIDTLPGCVVIKFFCLFVHFCFSLSWPDTELDVTGVCDGKCRCVGGHCLLSVKCNESFTNRWELYCM